jgi:hypothetical protein
MRKIHNDVKEGKENLGVDLITIIRKDLNAFIIRYEQESGLRVKKQWPEMKLQDLRQTTMFCQWSNILAS